MSPSWQSFPIFSLILPLSPLTCCFSESDKLLEAYLWQHLYGWPKDLLSVDMGLSVCFHIHCQWSKVIFKDIHWKKMYICLLSVCRHIMSCATNIAHFINAIHSPFHTLYLQHVLCHVYLFIYLNNTVLQVHLIVTSKLIELYPRWEGLCCLDCVGSFYKVLYNHKNQATAWHV